MCGWQGKQGWAGLGALALPPCAGRVEGGRACDGSGLEGSRGLVVPGLPANTHQLPELTPSWKPSAFVFLFPSKLAYFY